MAAGVFLGTVLLSILAYVVGMVVFVAGGSLTGANSLTDADRVFGDNVGTSYEKDPETGLTPTFFSLLALFYPSVTGIMAGTNRSALLSNAGRSIPRGTLGAIGTTTAIYVGTVWLFGAFVSNETLKTNKLVVAAAAWPHPMLVNVGIIMSSIGAALQCLTGAPQLLSAIAHDKARGSGAGAGVSLADTPPPPPEPRRRCPSSSPSLLPPEQHRAAPSG